MKKKKRISEPPFPPPSSIGRIIIEGSNADCPLCHSTVKYKWFGLGKSIGCIQPLCENYYKKNV